MTWRLEIARFSPDDYRKLVKAKEHSDIFASKKRFNVFWITFVDEAAYVDAKTMEHVSDGPGVPTDDTGRVTEGPLCGLRLLVWGQGPRCGPGCSTHCTTHYPSVDPGSD